jgi:hypothetical protein
MTFQKNVGGVDRGVRIVLGIAIMALGVYFESFWGVLGVVVLATGIFQFCGLYTLFGASTCKVEQKSDQ